MFVIYFKPGCQTLVDVADAIERRAGAGTATGTNFIIVYTASPGELGDALAAIQGCKAGRVAPLVIDRIEFLDVDGVASLHKGNGDGDGHE